MLGGERHAVVLNQPLRGGRFNQRQTALLNTLVQPVRDFVRNLVLRVDILSAFSQNKLYWRKSVDATDHKHFR